MADKLGCYLRSNWVKYFQAHPEDLALTKKLIRKNGSNLCASTLSRDVRTNYMCAGFNDTSCLWFIRSLETGDYSWYAKERKRTFMGISRAVGVTLETLPKTKELGPEGIPF